MKLHLLFSLLALHYGIFASPLGREIDGKYSSKLFTGEIPSFDELPDDIHGEFEFPDFLSLDENGEQYLEKLFPEAPAHENEVTNGAEEEVKPMVTEATPVVDEKMEEMTSLKVPKGEEHDHIYLSNESEEVFPQRQEEEEEEEKHHEEKMEKTEQNPDRKVVEEETHVDEEDEEVAHEKEVMAGHPVLKPWLLPESVEEPEQRWDIEHHGDDLVDYQHTDEEDEGEEYVEEHHEDEGDLEDHIEHEEKYTEVEETGTPFPAEHDEHLRVLPLEQPMEHVSPEEGETYDNEYTVPESDYSEEHVGELSSREHVEEEPFLGNHEDEEHEGHHGEEHEEEEHLEGKQHPEEETHYEHHGEEHVEETHDHGEHFISAEEHPAAEEHHYEQHRGEEHIEKKHDGETAKEEPSSLEEEIH